jgi:hypothetical protein
MNLYKMITQGGGINIYKKIHIKIKKIDPIKTYKS